MIKGVHTMFYSSEAEKLRTFLRDVVGFKASDIGHGWLIFDLPEADMGCHPASDEHGVPSGTQDISFYCDDIQQTVKELKDRGIQFRGGIEEWLWLCYPLPGTGRFVQLYQPKYGK